MSWEAFFEAYPDYMSEVKQIAHLYPEKRSVEIAYEDIDMFDCDFCWVLTDKPDGILKRGREVMRDIIEPLLDKDVNGSWRIFARINKVPRNLRVGIRDLRTADLGRLIMVEGIASRVTEVRPMAINAAFRCARCSHVSMVPQDSPFMQEPLECAKNKDGGGGCGRAIGSTKMTYEAELSQFIDIRKVEIQERPEGLRGGSQPQTLVAVLTDDLCQKEISPGDKVMFVGIIKATPKDKKFTTHDIWLDTNNYETVDAERDMDITPEEMVKIRELAASENVQAVITSSIAPTIYGHNIIKKAIMLQMFGGVQKKQPDGTIIRGDSHVLLVGDPGTAKTQMLRYTAKIMPRGMYASGKASTAAGLTACATKDDFGEGKWTLEAGVLVLADGGMACIDELDKMNDNDRDSMHEAMEQQTITINKASIRSTLHSQCAVLAAANPKHGRFDASEYIATQIDLPPALFTRFDLIFPISDVPDSKLDGLIADHILKSHLSGQADRRQRAGQSVENMAEILEARKAVQPTVEPEFLRKYVFVGRTINPLMSDIAMARIKEFYTSIRKMGERENAPVPITARQLEGLIRLSEASARSRLSESLELYDAEVAIAIMQEFLDRVIGRGGVAMDIDGVEGVPKTQRDVMVLMDKILREFSSGFIYADFLDFAEAAKIPRDKAEAILNRWLSDGVIYQKGYKDITEENGEVRKAKLFTRV